MSQENDIVERMSKLEAELASLKNNLEARTQHPLEKVRNVAKFFLSYWTLFSFLFAVVVMIYVKYTFDIDYFENYRSVAEIRNLSDFHRKMGDEFMGKTEWQAAQKAYEQALEIDKNNMQAAYGLVKSQVFQPLEGEKFYFPEVVNTRLNYLSEYFPDDYLLSYLRATYYVDKHELVQARQWFEKSMQQNPDYSWNHVAMGYIQQQEGDFESAINSFQQAIKLDPENETANSNLGYAYLYSGNFAKAMQHLQAATIIAPDFATYYGLADTYLYQKDFANALSYRQYNLEKADKNAEGTQRFLKSAGLWMYGFMPLKPGDKETIKRFVQSSGLDNQRLLIYFATSLDYAFNKDFAQADALFKKGMEGDKEKLFHNFFLHKIVSLQNFLEPEAEINQWLESRKAELSGAENPPS